jgi:hypothetical protein
MAQKSPDVDAVHAAVDAWFAEMIQQPPISYAVEAYNQAHVACADLHRRLHAVLTGEELPTPAPSDPVQPEPETKAVKPAGTKE